MNQTEKGAQKPVMITLHPDFVKSIDEHWKKNKFTSRSAYFDFLARRDMAKE